MTTTTQRRCRMCPAVFTGDGEADQCGPCSERSAALQKRWEQRLRALQEASNDD